MKYLLISSLILINSFSSNACDCYDSDSFCGVLNNSASWLQNEDYSKIVCYVEYTGNNLLFSLNNPYRGLYEVKVMDLFYGEIQPGGYPDLVIGEDFLNTDSTFWVVSGLDSCADIFILEEGDYAVMATSIGYDGIYDFFACSNDLQIFSEPLPAAEYNDLVQEIETCLNAHCEEDLTLSGIQSNEFLYQGATISSTANINASEIVYKASDRITLQSGFGINDNRTFSAKIETICD